MGWSKPLLLMTLLLQSCNSNRTEAHEAGATALTLSPSEVATLHQEPALQERLLYTPYQQAVSELGSLRFEATSSFVFTQGAATVAQTSDYLALQDALGNFKIHYKTPHDQVEAYLIKDTFYIRQGLGNLRHKPRREIDSEQWGQLAFATLAQTLEPFRPFLKFSPGTPEQHLGRETLKFNLSLSSQPTTRSVDARALVRTGLPVNVPSQWRELAQPLSISGAIWVDTTSGVIVRSNLKGKIQISDKEVRPTGLELSYKSAVVDIGRVRPIKLQTSIEEHRRTKPPRNLLGFFKRHLPVKVPEASPTKN